MATVKITKDNFETAVLQAAKPVLVDFWAVWCGPCQMVGPILEEISDERDDLIVGKVNVDEEQELAAQFGVMSIPTMILFKGGEAAGKIVGAMPKEEILKILG
ncbi:MAG: thioredoxin [Clostridiales bacterium]|nr:thioredoxin [Clostridiales bacterium]